MAEEHKGATHHYEAYGLRVRSQVPLRFIPESPHGEWDVHVRLGRTPEALPRPRFRFAFWEASPGDFLLRAKGVARYRVTGGSEIVVQPEAGADPAAVEVILLGSVLAALLRQRGIVPMHASAVQAPAGAVLFAGWSGVGKSTLLGALVKRDYPMLADDVAGVVLDTEGRPVVLSAFPNLRLWAAMKERLGYDSGQADQTARSGISKYVIGIERFGDVRTPLHQVFVLRSHNRKSIEIEPLAPADSFKAFFNEAAYRSLFMRGLGGMRQHFRVAAAAAKSVRVAIVTRPMHPFALDALADRVEECIRERPPGPEGTVAGCARQETREP